MEVNPDIHTMNERKTELRSVTENKLVMLTPSPTIEMLFKLCVKNRKFFSKLKSIIWHYVCAPVS
jgi:hypothetical protein